MSNFYTNFLAKSQQRYTADKMVEPAKNPEIEDKNQETKNIKNDDVIK